MLISGRSGEPLHDVEQCSFKPCLHGLAPKYLAELCVPVADVAGAVNYVLVAEDF